MKCIIYNLVIFKLLLFCTYTFAPVVQPMLEASWKCSFCMAVRLAVTYLIFSVCVQNYDWISWTDAKQRLLSPVLRLWKSQKLCWGRCRECGSWNLVIHQNCHTVRLVWHSAFCGVESKFFPIPVIFLSGIPAFFQNSNIKNEIHCLSWRTEGVNHSHVVEKSDQGDISHDLMIRHQS